LFFLLFLIGLVIFGILFLVTFGVVTVKRRSEVEPGGTIGMRTIYIYAVLFATLMMSIGGSIGAFMAIADIVSPSAYYESYEQYKMTQQQKDGKQAVANEEQLKKEYAELVENQKQQAKERAMNALIKSLGWIAIPLPIFIYFQRRVRSSDES
jgi:hypothetical protein